MPYISVTGLRLKGVHHAPRFWWHAIRSMLQARAAPGNLKAEAKKIAVVHHTVTVWTNRDAMRQFLVTGAHLQAMKSFRSIATGRVAGFEADEAPRWQDVPEILNARGRDV